MLDLDACIARALVYVPVDERGKADAVGTQPQGDAVVHIGKITHLCERIYEQTVGIVEYVDGAAVLFREQGAQRHVFPAIDLVDGNGYIFPCGRSAPARKRRS